MEPDGADDAAGDAPSVHADPDRNLDLLRRRLALHHILHRDPHPHDPRRVVLARLLERARADDVRVSDRLDLVDPVCLAQPVEVLRMVESELAASSPLDPARLARPVGGLEDVREQSEDSLRRVRRRELGEANHVRLRGGVRGHVMDES